jgi:hypothetical protein
MFTTVQKIPSCLEGLDWALLGGESILARVCLPAAHIAARIPI